MEKRFSIGVMTDSFKKPFFEALDKAVEVGAQGIQLYVVEGEMSYKTFDDAKVKAVKSEGTTDITLYITNREWNACGYGGECDDNGFPIGYFD